MDNKQQTINYKETIYPEQVKLLYKSFRISAVGSIVAATIFLIITLQYSAQTYYIYPWFVTFCILTLIRLVTWYLYTKSSPVSNYHFWDRLFFIGVILASILWGCIGFFSLGDANEVYLTLIFLMLVGVNSFAVTTLAYIKNYMYIFYLLSVLPFFLLQLTMGNFFNYIMLAFVVLFTVLILSSTRRIYYFVEQNFYLQRKTEMKNKELVEANEAKSRFLSNMSHELRTPLNAINGYSQILLLNSEDNLNQEQIENIETILSSGEHLLSLINEILDHAKIESGKMEAILEPIDIVYVVTSCIQMIEHLAEKRGITIDTQITDSVIPEICADKKKLKQVFLNLLTNAIKYNKVNGRITIKAIINKANELEIGIIDTGCGLNKEQQEKLFRPFERIRKDVENVEGTGLGLVICKQLVNLMGGDIYVVSEPGKGSQFWLKFPLVWK